MVPRLLKRQRREETRNAGRSQSLGVLASALKAQISQDRSTDASFGGGDLGGLALVEIDDTAHLERPPARMRALISA